MLHSLFMLAALVGGMSMPLAIDDANVIEEKVEFKQETKRLVSYDDENYKIELSANEVDNYSFDNFFTLIFNESDYEVISLLFASTDYAFYSYNQENEYINYMGSGDTFIFYGNVELFNADMDKDFTIHSSFYSGADGEPPYDEPLVITCTSGTYSAVKQAIELDIQANENTQPNMMPVLEEIVSLLTGGIIGISTGLGGGVSDLVTNIFLNNGQLSVFGAIIAVFAGISLAIGLSRWVMNFLTSLGAKK